MNRGAAQLSLGLILLVAVFIGAVALVHNVLTAPYPGHNDFMSRWEGARSFFIDGLNPYGEEASLNIQQRIYGRPVVDGEDPGYFAYPFYTALLVWPLVYVSYAWASAVWMVLLAGCMIVSLFLLFDLFRSWPSPILMSGWLLWVLGFYFTARGLILGQPGILVYFLEVVALWALAKDRDALAGIALAVSTLKPQMGFLIVPFLLLYGLAFRRWRFIAFFIGAMAFLLGMSFMLQPSWLGDWVAQLGLYPSYTALGSPVWIITSYYLGLGNWAELAINAALVVFMLWGWYGVLVRHQRERVLWAVVLTLTVTHLIAPRTATPHYVVFIIPLVFYCVLLQRANRRQGALLVGLILLALLVIPWLHFIWTVDGEFEHPTLYLPLPFLSLALLWFLRRQWWDFSASMISRPT